ncbi:hypothetical protein [Clostridium manihotivorum]|uniref:hypothetical protein n=1 Tax=Clostridium manihotivorum TaxID=2320868 RepID=UPI00196A3046|nr:hypothetical protein [Clostridium manihotivorum]
MICSDFHPFQKVSDVLGLEKQTDIFDGEMVHARFFSEDIRRQMPLCSYRKYNISEIINAVMENGFTLNRFDEHPSWTKDNVQEEFTIVARKN